MKYKFTAPVPWFPLEMGIHDIISFHLGQRPLIRHEGVLRELVTKRFDHWLRDFG